MLQNLKALFWVLLAALPTFALLQPTMISVMGKEAFARRRNIWLAVSVLAFMLPDFWTFLPAYLLLLVVVRKQEENPVALLLLLMYAVPLRLVDLPSIAGIPLFGVHNVMILTLVLLLPALMSRTKENTAGALVHDSRPIYLAMLLFCAIQIVFWMPAETFTHSMRRSVTMLIDTVLLYIGVAKLLKTEQQVRDALMCFAMACALMAASAIPEVLQHWQLYTDVAARWTRYGVSTYGTREGSLRAIVATDTPITLGHLFACAGVILWMSRESLKDAKQRERTLAGIALLAIGLYLARSRAPWISAVLVVVVYVSLVPGASRRLSTLLVGGALFALPFSMTEAGSKFIDFLPFIGTVDSGNVDYRVAMQQALWNVIWASPWTGNPYTTAELEHLRQGQGIIDLLNVYAVFGAMYGLPCAIAFLACFVFALKRLWKYRTRSILSRDPNKQYLAASVISLIVAHMVFLTTMSYVASTSTLTWILLGIASSGGFTIAAITRRASANTTGTANA